MSVNRLAEDGGYKDRIILITGGTGFLGKVLVEKLLRTCPLIAKIYLMVRIKKGKNPEQRTQEIFSHPLFDMLKEARGEAILKKVVAISCDLMDARLGLAEDDRRKLTDEVHMIFHSAASIRFDEPFKDAILMNVRATKLMLELAKECKHLLVFCHVSTAYCQTQEKVLYEKTYPPLADPKEILQIAETMNMETLEDLKPKILGTCPNSYSFTKAVGEALVSEEMDTLPIIIVRPSVVVPVAVEPLPGWCNTLVGPMGLVVGAGKGIIRTMYCDPTKYMDFIPVDIAINMLMVSTFDYLLHKKRRVYNCTTTFDIKLPWTEIIETGRRVVEYRVPYNWVVWYPGGSLTTNKFIHNVCVVLFHYIPAIFLDAIIFLTGNKPVLWRIQRKITNGFELFEYFTSRQWEFDNESMLTARKLMTDIEREIYGVDVNGLDLEEYMYNWVVASRRYLLNEPDDTIPAARRHMKIMWLVDRLCKALLVIGLIYYFFM